MEGEGRTPIYTYLRVTYYTYVGVHDESEYSLYPKMFRNTLRYDVDTLISCRGEDIMPHTMPP